MKQNAFGMPNKLPGAVALLRTGDWQRQIPSRMYVTNKIVTRIREAEPEIRFPDKREKKFEQVAVLITNAAFNQFAPMDFPELEAGRA